MITKKGFIFSLASLCTASCVYANHSSGGDAKVVSPQTDASSSTTTSSSLDISKGFSSVAEKALPAVVNVATTQIIEAKDRNFDLPRFAPGSPFEEFFKEFFDQVERPRRVQSLGSGFIVQSDDTKAFIVTNHHVIADAKKISIFLHDKTELEATVQAYDERTDLAVLKVSTESLPKGKRKLPVLAWGNSGETKVGDWVLAIGNPFGLGSTVTAGIISSKGRDLVTQSNNRVGDYVDDFIQHSAQINMGNSGGCLLSVGGEVIGINTAIFSPSGGNVGIGFAIPACVAKSTVDQLIEFGRTKRGWLGVRIQNLTEEMAESLGLKDRGAIIGSVTPEGPAHKAGILSGDVILSFDDKPINETNRLSRLVGETPVGKSCKLKVWRKGKELIFDVKVGEFEEAIQKGKLDDDQMGPFGGKSLEILGMQVSPLPQEMKTSQKGVVISKIDPESAALDSGLLKGDIIVEANQKTLTSPRDFHHIIEAAKNEKKRNVLLLVVRGGTPRFVSLKIEEPEKKSDVSSKNPQKKPQGSDEKKKESIPEHPANVPSVPPAA